MDLFLKTLALAGFLGFLLVLVIHVPVWNLMAVLAVCAAMAIYDFLFYRPRRRRPVS